MNHLVGQTLGKYQIIERVGHGGMAEVYKAYQASLNRHVALKVMHPHLAEDPDFISRFGREATAVARLRHPNIVLVHDFDTVENLYYMVMEFIEGATLKEDLRQRQAREENTAVSAPYTLPEIAYILTSLSSALDYAHTQGVIHRDLKPGNIMFTTEGQVIITDFGLVRLLDNNTQDTPLPHVVTGTPAYMSPEQAQGHDVDNRTDIYALGVIIYELLAGKTPHQADSAFNILAKRASDLPLPKIERTDILPAIEEIVCQALAYDPTDRFASAGSFAQAFREAIDLTMDEMMRTAPATMMPLIRTPITGQEGISRAHTPLSRPACPYRGLFAFREEDAHYFFGREEFTQKLVTAVGQQNLLPIIGPSGSGKSSVIFAGLIPALRQEEKWLICALRPGSQPLQALSAAFLRHLEPTLSEIDRLVETRRFAKTLQQTNHLNGIINRLLERHEQVNKVLLVIDQFEELYTLSKDTAVRQKFLDLITAQHLGDTFHIVLSLRADFLGQALAHPAFAQLIQDSPLIIGPMNRPQLTRAVENPASIQKIKFETGLVERILDDVGFEPGNLPLLEFALTALWDEQTSGYLTHTAYDKIGRVDGALARHAEHIYAHLSLDEKEQARTIFTQLVRPGDGTEDTRRPATRQEIGEQNWSLVQKLASARLVVTNRDPEKQETAEVVHEALIRSWDRLRIWMDTDRNFRLWQERLRAALHQWQENNEDYGALLRGAPLTEATEWLHQHSGRLTPPEQRFIETSLTHREKQRQAREQLRRRIIGGLVIGFVITLLLSITSLWQLNNALAAQTTAIHERDQARASLSRQLATQANAIRDTDFDLSSLLSIAALDTADTLVARDSLLNSLLFNPRLMASLPGHDGQARTVAYHPNGAYLASGGVNGHVIIWELATRQPIVDLAAHDSQVQALSYTPDGRYLLSTGTNDGITVRDAQNNSYERLTVLNNEEQNAPPVSLAIAPDSVLVAAGSADGQITLWNLSTQRVVQQLDGHTDQINDLAFSPDGRLLASSSVDQTAIVWDVAQGEMLWEPFTGHNGIVWSVAFHPNSQQLSTGGGDGLILTWNLNSGQQNRRPLAGEKGWVTSLAYLPEGDKLIAGNRFNDILVWDMDRQTLDADYGPLSGHTDIVWDLALSPTAVLLASVSQDGRLYVWNLERNLRVGPQASAPLQTHTDSVQDVAFTPDGQTMISGGKDTAVVFWDMTDTTPTSRIFFTANPVNTLSVSSDGNLLATGHDNGNIILWDIDLRRPFNEPLRNHDSAIQTLIFSPDNKILASAGTDSRIHLWDTATRQPIGQPLIGHNGTVWTLAFTPDGNYLVSGAGDGQILIWQITTQRQAAPPLTIHNNSVTSLAIDPTGVYMASAGEDRAIWLWSLADLNQYLLNPDMGLEPVGAPLVGHERRINDLAFSPDGQMLASGASGRVNTAGDVGAGDDLIILWNVAQQELIGQPLQSGHGRVFGLAFSPDGQKLASTGWDSNVMLWSISPKSWITALCVRINRDFTEQEWQRYIGTTAVVPYCQNASP